MFTKKPFCKVCHDAGKPESEFTNHWVKDLNGKITCPTLLNNECRYCFKRGHTIKFCAVLAKNNKEIKPKTINKPLIQKKPVFQNKPTNGFAVLCNDDDEEEITNIVFGIEKPRLVEKKVSSWADIAATPAIILKPEVKQDKQISKPIQKPIQGKSWADWTDSEDEEDKEDELSELSDLSDLSCDEENGHESCY